MPRVVAPRTIVCLAFGVGLGLASAAANEKPTLTAVWEQVAQYFSKEAAWAMKDLPPAPDAATRRERDFCAAVVLLDQQPLSEARLDDAERRFKALLAADPADDDIDRASLYLLGRIAQIYRASPDVEQAAAYYRRLLGKPHPGHWAELARVKLAILELYALPAGDPPERLAAVNALLAGAHSDVGRRDLHRLAARGIMFYNLAPADALKHLLAADAIGGLTGTPAADQLVQIGELAWDTGQVDLAKKYYDRLRVEFPLDVRIYLMDRRLAGASVPTRGKELHGR